VTDIKNFKKVLLYMPKGISSAMNKISTENTSRINEIRLRINKPVSVSSYGKNYFVTENGGLTTHKSLGIVVQKNDINECFRAICDYSLHSYTKEISEGFITLEGGNRVGISGTAVLNGNYVETLKYINGINFRISGQVFGCSEKICERLYDVKPVSLLIIGPPLSGKTTILKDMCRILGEKYKISVIDERSEIAAVYHGEAKNDIGTFTDIFDGYPKGEGITSAVRVMSPEIVICDEIGGKRDCNAILDSVNSGVKFIATVHGSSVEEVLKRRNIADLISNEIFQYGVLLGSGSRIGEVMEIKKIV
jgi:stage III sporulation protein AA